MNAQQQGPQRRGIEWTHIFGHNTGFTWPIWGGCFHDCRWKMPDGTMAICYARDIAEKFRSDRFYAQGFQHAYFNPVELNAPLAMKKRAGIFIASMADPMGHWVPDAQIHQVLDVCARASQHVFFLLTKNAPRLKTFRFPPNVFVGVSIPPTYMNGHPLEPYQQAKMMDVALNALSSVDVPVRWISAEPLSWNIADSIRDANIQWLVIGAASRGSVLYQPRFTDVRDALAVADKLHIPVFLKDNLLRYPQRRQEWPSVPSIAQPAPQPVAVTLPLF